MWKIYKAALNIEIGELQQLCEFDLTDDLVENKPKERYGNNIPLDEKGISPAAMFDSDQLITVALNWWVIVRKAGNGFYFVYDMSAKRSLLSSIFSMRCPRCREGKMFPERLYSRRFMKTNKTCPCCGQPFLLEPGFFLGSAYFSYLINGLLLFAIAYALYFSGAKITIAAMVISIVVVIFGFLPFTLRFSKSVWIHIFVRYEGSCDEIPGK